jgi:hypothetical protein
MAGATGWTGRAIAAGILDADDLTLTGALARKSAGLDVGDVLGRPATGVKITADVGAALEGAEVLATPLRWISFGNQQYRAFIFRRNLSGSTQARR